MQRIYKTRLFIGVILFIFGTVFFSYAGTLNQENETIMLVSATEPESTFSNSEIYKKYIEDGQSYENNNKFAFALDSYGQAIAFASSQEEIDSAVIKYYGIRNKIVSGNPWGQDFDDFEMIDQWIELFKEAETVIGTQYSLNVYYIPPTNKSDWTIDVEAKKYRSSVKFYLGEIGKNKCLERNARILKTAINSYAIFHNIKEDDCPEWVANVSSRIRGWPDASIYEEEEILKNNLLVNDVAYVSDGVTTSRLLDGGNGYHIAAYATFDSAEYDRKPLIEFICSIEDREGNVLGSGNLFYKNGWGSKINIECTSEQKKQVEENKAKIKVNAVYIHNDVRNANSSEVHDIHLNNIKENGAIGIVENMNHYGPYVIDFNNGLAMNDIVIKEKVKIERISEDRVDNYSNYSMVKEKDNDFSSLLAFSVFRNIYNKYLGNIQQVKFSFPKKIKYKNGYSVSTFLFLFFNKNLDYYSVYDTEGNLGNFEKFVNEIKKYFNYDAESVLNKEDYIEKEIQGCGDFYNLSYKEWKEYAPDYVPKKEYKGEGYIVMPEFDIDAVHNVNRVVADILNKSPLDKDYYFVLTPIKGYARERKEKHFSLIPSYYYSKVEIDNFADFDDYLKAKNIEKGSSTEELIKENGLLAYVENWLDDYKNPYYKNKDKQEKRDFWVKNLYY